MFSPYYLSPLLALFPNQSNYSLPSPLLPLSGLSLPISTVDVSQFHPNSFHSTRSNSFLLPHNHMDINTRSSSSHPSNRLFIISLVRPLRRRPLISHQSHLPSNSDHICTGAPSILFAIHFFPRTLPHCQVPFPHSWIRVDVTAYRSHFLYRTPIIVSIDGTTLVASLLRGCDCCCRVNARSAHSFTSR